jgi:FkbM family methyltransferase
LALNRLWEGYGLARSLLMYYGKPFGMRRLVQFYKAFVQPGDLCFDVGAHVGNRTAAFLRLGARVLAIEPQPAFVSLLRRLYGTHPNATLINAALGAAPGETEMLISSRTPTVSTLSETWASAVRQTAAFSWVKWDQVHRVAIMTLDTLIEQYGLPAFCKIDVEGYEMEVLRGLSQPIPALSFEYVPATIPLTEQCIDQLNRLGDYRFNLAPGESLSLWTEEWLTADSILTQLRQMPSGAKSGDIYARLCQP